MDFAAVALVLEWLLSCDILELEDGVDRNVVPGVAGVFCGEHTQIVTT